VPELSVRVLARPHWEAAAAEEFLADSAQKWTRTPGATDAEELVEFAGRICYMSFGKRQSPRDNSQYIHNLIRQGHESVLEHANWTFLVAGVSRAFTHQLVRHRIGFSFSQLSQQYHDESDAMFVVPEIVNGRPELLTAWQGIVDQARNSYNLLLSRLIEAEPTLPAGLGDPREVTRAVRSAARSLLPNATETKIVVTANARALRHFFDVRGNIVGDLEMRRVSSELFKAVTKDASSLFADFEIVTLQDGFPAVIRKP
jgi:thymidylate synthase (FAD)